MTPIYETPITMEEVETLSKEELQVKIRPFMIPELKEPFTFKYMQANEPVFRALLKYPDLEFEFFHGVDLFGRILLEVNAPELNNQHIMSFFTIEEMSKIKDKLSTVVNNSEVVTQAISLLRQFETIEEVSYFYEANMISKDDIVNNNKAISDDLRKQIALLF